MDIFQEKQAAKIAGAKWKSLSGAELQKIRVEQPDLYRTLRAGAQAAGILGPPSYGVPSDLPKSRERVYSTEEITARARWSEQDCIRFYRDNTAGDKNTIAALQKSDPEGARLLRIAAQSFGTIAVTPHVEKKSPLLTPPADPEVRIAIGERLGAAVNLPATYRAGPLEFEAIVRIAAEKDAAAGEQK